MAVSSFKDLSALSLQAVWSFLYRKRKII